MTILKNLCVKNGSYTDRDGKERGRWVTVGQIHESNKGGVYYTIDAHVNFAAFQRNEGDSRVTLSAFDPKKYGDAEEKPSSRPRQEFKDPIAGGGMIDDDIPF